VSLRQDCIAAAIGTAVFVSPALCQNGDKANWQSVEADNGALYKIDLNSISHLNNGTADAIVYAVDGAGYNPENMRRLWFDCHGHYQDLTGPGVGPTQYAPPRSIAGRLSEIACASAKGAPSQGTTRPQANATPSNGAKFINRSYNLTISATRERFPDIVGSTNFPDGTKLLVSINKPRLPNAAALLAAGLPACETDCVPASGPKGEMLGVSIAVLSGAFSAGPFSWGGKPFQQGTFEVEIYLVSLPGEDSKNLAVFEMQAERMNKPILKTSVNMTPER
jgi:hypothetical protein